MKIKIEFFTDEDSCHNVRFEGDLHASNEVILGIFYDYPSEHDAQIFLEDVAKVLKGDLPKDEELDYDFGDFICGELHKDFTILEPDGPITSKTYRVDTLDLRNAIQAWIKFGKRDEPGLSKMISLNVDII